MDICPPVTGQRQILTVGRSEHTFHCIDYFMLGGICTCCGVSSDPMFLWISSNFSPLNLLLVQNLQRKIITTNGLIRGRNNITRMRVEPRSCNQVHCKNHVFAHSVTLPTSLSCKSGLVLCSIFFKHFLKNHFDYNFLQKCILVE